ncbi:unnamed protein product [Brassica oleracea]
MRKAILLSKRTSTTSQDAPTQPYGVRHIRNKKKGCKFMFVAFM